MKKKKTDKMNATIQEALDLTYEFEGLLDITLLRDEIPERMLQGIKDKASRIYSLAESIDAEEDNGDVAAPQDETSVPHEEGHAPAQMAREEAPTAAVEEDTAMYEIDDEMVDEIEERGGERIVPEKIEHGGAEKKNKPAFSVNDRFLYSRELFGGKLEDFERAMNEVAALENYEEAEEYFYAEWDFDPENPVVEDFMLRISRYFS